MNNTIFQKIYELLTLPEHRVPGVYNWLISDVWSEERFLRNDPKEYLEGGEKIVHTIEELITFSAYGIYDELSALAMESKNLLDELAIPKTALVVFDGASLRELPLLKINASSCNFQIVECGCRVSSLPSDTVNFVDQRLLGKLIGPSQLPARKELKDKNIRAFYYDSPVRHYDFPSDGSSLLLWSSFPDATYMNYEAKNANHFDAIAKQFDVVWKNIILGIPKDYRIIITSDHGYIYLNAGFQSNERGEEALRFLKQDRFRFYDNNENPPDVNELQIIQSKHLAMLRGRIINRMQGPAANKVFRHGGLSLMEMFTPWLVLERN